MELKALSIQQPWAWAILHAGKDIENRTWRTNHRGKILIHAPQEYDYDGMVWMRQHEQFLGLDQVPGWATTQMIRGGIIGVADLVDCVTESPSKWFFGPHGFVLKNPRPFTMVPCKGRLSLFNIDEATQRMVLDALIPGGSNVT